jgi:hypothetical protein
VRTLVFWSLIVFITGLSVPPIVCPAPSPTGKCIYQPLLKPGEKISLDANTYFTYGFTKRPKLGLPIMKVEVFNRDGKRDTSYIVSADADMPSMRGAHSTGYKVFSISARGLYLLPVSISMPGDWEIKFTFVKKGKEVFRGAYLFSI